MTAPHRAEHGIEERIDYVRQAWPHFLKALNAWLRDLEETDVEWLRAFEYEPGKDRQGHPHFHVWLLSPFLPARTLQDLWRSALQRVGFPVGNDEHVSIDIQRMKSRDGAAQEIIKYMTKDLVAKGRYVEPADWARVYRKLDATRTVQSSRGFIQLGDSAPACSKCGERDSFVVKRVRGTSSAPPEAGKSTSDAISPCRERATEARASQGRPPR